MTQSVKQIQEDFQTNLKNSRNDKKRSRENQERSSSSHIPSLIPERAVAPTHGLNEQVVAKWVKGQTSDSR